MCELTDVCGALKSRGIHFTAHPTECAAFVQCDGVTRATVMAVPEGTIWDNVVSTPVHLQAGSCAQSKLTSRSAISVSVAFSYAYYISYLFIRFMLLSIYFWKCFIPIFVKAYCHAVTLRCDTLLWSQISVILFVSIMLLVLLRKKKIIIENYA